MNNKIKEEEQKSLSIQLPLFIDKTILPTKKFHISFSEISVREECSFRHKLKYIDEVEGGIDESMHLIAGHVVHSHIETWFLTKKPIDTVQAVADFQKEYDALTIGTQQKQGIELYVQFINNLPDMLQGFPEWIQETFPDYKFVAAEYNLFEPIQNQPNIHFKGFIDLVIKVPKKQTKKEIKNNEPIKWIYWVLDLKTCAWGWKAEQKREFKKQAQLILYKHFFHDIMKENVDIKDIRTGFILLKRVIPKTPKRFARYELVKISVGPKTLDKANLLLYSSVNHIRKSLAFKNKGFACRFCEYDATDHCI